MKTISIHTFTNLFRGFSSIGSLRRLGVGSILFASSILCAESVRVLEETSIPYMSFLSKADFDQRYPGEMLEDPAQLDAGWYVIYQHQALNYYFGPILLQSIGEDYLAQLTETVEAAVAERPSIQDYRLELSYEPQATNSQSPEDVDEPILPNATPAPTESKNSFWGMIKKVFGFG
jgi:hypothetical protein